MVSFSMPNLGIVAVGLSALISGLGVAVGQGSACVIMNPGGTCFLTVEKVLAANLFISVFGGWLLWLDMVFGK